MEEFILGNKIVHKYKESGQRKVYKIQNDTYGECILKMGRCMSSNAMERMKRETERPLFFASFLIIFSSSGVTSILIFILKLSVHCIFFV